MSTVTREPAEQSADVPAPDTAPARRLPAELLTYVAAALLSTLVTFVSLQLWRARLDVPFTYWGDAIAVAAHFKTVLETGWYEYQPLLGAPAGQTYHDFPTADNLHLVVAHVLGWFTSDVAVAMNLYYLLGFVLTALAAVWFLRECGVSRPLSVALAVLLAVAPYHFLRGEGHLWLASYYPLPLALVIVLRVLRGEHVWGRGRRGGVLGLLTGRGATTVVVLALLATASSYYAVFVVILLAVAGGAAFLRDHDWRRFAGAAGAGLVLVAVVLANMAPDLVYAHRNGTSAAGLVRNAAEVEIYALKLAQLLLPVPGHRFDLFERIRGRYDSTYPLLSENPSLGIVAALGLVCALAVPLLRLVRRSPERDAADPTHRSRTGTIELLSLLVVVAFLCSTVGGLATFLSFLTSSLRGWNRMSIVIAVLSLAVVGLVIDAFLAYLARRQGWSTGVRRGAAVVVAGGLVVVGSIDQVPRAYVPAYEASAVAYAADEEWVTTVEDALPEGAMVFQLPYAGFPETPSVNGVFDTDQLRPYLHSDDLRWSGGGIKGRSTTDWGAVVAQQSPPRMVTNLTAAGFAAVVVDRTAYGEAAGPIERELAEAAGAPVAESRDGRFALYSLLDEAESLDGNNPPEAVREVAEAVVAPVLPYAGKAVGTMPGPTGRSDWVLPPGSEGIVLDNGRDDSVPLRVQASVTSQPGTDESIVLRIGDAEVTVPLTAGVGVLDERVDVPPGRTVITVDSPNTVTLGGLVVEEVGVPELVP
ncbi:hypothetical protein ACWFNE_16015 [Cellulomonas sp. NPDC055163]